MADYDNWVPQKSLQEVDSMLTSPGSFLEVETILLDGRLNRVYKNLFPSLRGFWLWALNEHGPKDYISYEGTNSTFQEVFTESVRAAAVFHDVYGIRKGDRVGICSRNYPSYLAAFWACQLLGAVSVLPNAWLPVTVLSHCVNHTQCKLLIVDAERADLFSPVMKELVSTSGFLVFLPQNEASRWKNVQTYTAALAAYRGDPRQVVDKVPAILPEDNATIMFTSGTTGLPRGVLSTQRMFLTNVFNLTVAASRAVLRRGEVLEQPTGPQKGILVPVPFFHVTGLTSLTMNGTLSGRKLVLMHKWNAQEAARLIVKENVGISGGVPSMVLDLLHTGLKDLEGVSFGGSSAASSLPGRAKATFPSATVAQGYGLTETNSVAVSIAGEDYLSRPTCAGLPTLVNELVVMKDDKAVPPRELGEVWIRGPNVMKEYWGDHAATSKAITRDGWFRTGDLGFLDEEGFLYIRDRIKDVIIRGGENVDSVSVENALYLEPAVLEAAAVGIPDERLGELVAACVVVQPGKTTEQQLIALARERLPRFAVPVMIIVMHEPLEKNASGKIVKTILRGLVKAEWEKRKTGKAKL